MSPQPETHTTTTTPGAVPERVAISRQTPVPEAHTATITSAGSVENIAAIQRAPTPEAHKAAVTPGSHVASIAVSFPFYKQSLWVSGYPTVASADGTAVINHFRCSSCRKHCHNSTDCCSGSPSCQHNGRSKDCQHCCKSNALFLYLRITAGAYSWS